MNQMQRKKRERQNRRDQSQQQLWFIVGRIFIQPFLSTCSRKLEAIPHWLTVFNHTPVNKLHDFLVVLSGSAIELKQGASPMNARAAQAHRLIRQMDTGRYLSAEGRWVENEDDAFDFPDIRTALATYEQMEHRRLEMILVFDKPRMEPALPA
jgi:hypothetical protein